MRWLRLRLKQWYHQWRSCCPKCADAMMWMRVEGWRCCWWSCSSIEVSGVWHKIWWWRRRCRRWSTKELPCQLIMQCWVLKTSNPFLNRGNLRLHWLRRDGRKRWLNAQSYMSPLLIIPNSIAISPLLLLGYHDISLILTKPSKHLEQFLHWDEGFSRWEEEAKCPACLEQSDWSVDPVWLVAGTGWSCCLEFFLYFHILFIF